MLAVEDLGIKDEITIVYEDACQAKDALNSAKKLVLVDDVDFITGVFCIASVLPISEQTKKYNISVMMPAAASDTIIKSDSGVFSVNGAIKDEAIAQARFGYQ